MFIVKYKPTGEYLMRTNGSPLDYFSDWSISAGRKLPLTNSISKARVYNQLGHVTNSIGHLKKTGTREYIWYSRNGEKHIEETPVYETIVDTNTWEIIEVEIAIKEK